MWYEPVLLCAVFVWAYLRYNPSGCTGGWHIQSNLVYKCRLQYMQEVICGGCPLSRREMPDLWLDVNELFGCFCNNMRSLLLNQRVVNW